MSIEIKITLPSANHLNNDGYARNALFKVIERGGQVESSAIMSIYRELDKRKRLDFIKRALFCCVFTKEELDEILTNHKRSRWVQTVAAIKQPVLSKKNADKKLGELVGKISDDIKALQKAGSPLWKLFYGPHSTNMRVFSASFNTPANNPKRGIDQFDENLLYDLFTEIASFLKEDSYVWNSRRIIDLVETGTRTSLLVPFISSESERISQYASSRMVEMLKNGGK